MPVHNEDIAAIFDELADLLEVEDANPFRVRAYRNGARTVRSLGRELKDLVAEGKDLSKLQGIGKALAAKIVEILETGHAKALDELHKEVPASVEAILRIPGLGPKRVKALYHTLGIRNIQQLEQAARSGRLRGLAGFGDKTERHILERIESQRQSKPRFLRSVAVQYAAPLVQHLEASPGVTQVVVAGSYRRGKETVGDLDILAVAKHGKKVMERFVSYDEVREVVSQGTTRSTVILRSGLQVDLRVVPKQSYGAALHYFTGSKAHNIKVRRLGQQRGLKINEYGVFEGDKRVAGDTEASVFRAVGLRAIPPELREDRGELDAAKAEGLPTLVAISDLQGDLHMHTTASDGRATLEEMVAAAKKRGLKYIAITDHSKRLTVAHGLDAERLCVQAEEIDELNGRVKGIKVLKGIEVDILEDGSLDLADDVLGRLDLVIGAVHSRFGLSRRRQTDRIRRAMDHPYFPVLAHPSGRLLQERAAYDVDLPQIIRHARERGCFMELDSQPNRLDLTDVYCHMAKEEGVLVSIDSDAHGEEGFENLVFGVAQARRGWLEKRDVLNTRSLRSLTQLLRQTMG